MSGTEGPTLPCPAAVPKQSCHASLCLLYYRVNTTADCATSTNRDTAHSGTSLPPAASHFRTLRVSREWAGHPHQNQSRAGDTAKAPARWVARAREGTSITAGGAKARGASEMQGRATWAAGAQCYVTRQQALSPLPTRASGRLGCCSQRARG